MNRMEKLENKKQEILGTLSRIKKGYEEGFINEDEYQHIKANNEKEIEKMDMMIQELQKPKEPTQKEPEKPQPAQEPPTNLQTRHFENQVLDKMDRFSQELNSMKNLMNGVEKPKKPEDSTRILTIIQVNDKFHQNIGMLSILSDRREIANELAHLENNVKRLKQLGMWDERKRKFLLNHLTYIMQLWRDEGHLSMSNLFVSYIKRMSLFNSDRHLQENKTEQEQEYILYKD